jgi:xanthine dehydrogenase accessory factor
MIHWPSQVQSFLDQGEAIVLVTLIEISGSAPQELGAKIIVTEAGLVSGTVGGGKVEYKAIQKSLELLKMSNAAHCELVEWHLRRDVGMTCGGLVKFLFEVYRPQAWKIAVFGAGHIAQELVPLLCKLDAHVTCVESREEWLSKLKDQNNLCKILSEDLKSQVGLLGEDTYYVIMTMGHASDSPVLTEVLTRYSPPFVGVIGSASKAAVLKKDLREAHISEEKIKSFFCPMGLPIGKSTPIEIAISVSAQLIQVRDSLATQALQGRSKSTSDTPMAHDHSL